MRFTIPKELSKEPKLFRVGPIALDKRQSVILLGTVLGYTFGYQRINNMFSLNSTQALALFVPIVLIALAVAFLRVDGRHPDWWAKKKVQNALRPSVLRWRRRGPSDKPLRDSIQEFLPADRLMWEMMRTDDGTYLMVLEIEPVSLSLSGPDEQQRVWTGTAQMYNKLDFPIIEITRSKKGNTAAYTQNLKEAIARSVDPGEVQLAEYARHYLRFLERIVPLYNVYDRTSYIVLPYRPPNPDLKTVKKRLISKKDAERLQQEAENAYRTLLGRVQTVYGSVTAFGARARLLTDVELQGFVKDEATGIESSAENPPTVWEPVTIESGGFARLSDNRRRQLMEVIKKSRKHAPPAIGIGNATLADKISPDAARIHPDYLRVGDRYHATLFVSEYPPDIAFGELQSLLHIPGRIKIVKYVKPLAQQKAVAALGGRVAELVAAEHTASDGDVIATQQRALARYSAETAMNQLISAQQSFFELTLLIHCEASTKAELYALVEDVRTKFAGLRGEAKLAREESWEGYVSALPMARNLLTSKYSAKGMLTNPLACFFVFGSQEINHQEGVLYGINPYSGALIAVDNRELMNPHMTVLGTSGGGKTMTIKAISTRLRMRNHRVVIVDPVGDSGYGPVAHQIGGQYVVFGLGTRHKFNPCELDPNYMDLSRLAAAEHDEDLDEARRQARAAALDGKILMLTRLVALMRSGGTGDEALSGRDHSKIDRLWYAVYAEKGITRDPDTHDKTPPTFKDFFRHLEQDPGLEWLLEDLYSWQHGTLSGIFGEHTNVNLDNKYLVLQIAGLEGRPKAAMMYAILDFLNAKLSNPEEVSECFIDELWSLLKYPMAAEFAEELWRSGRARNNGMVAITQELSEFLNSEQGQVIMRLSASQLVLRQQKKTIEILEQFHTFTESQKNQIINAQAGEGYLVVEENQIPLYVTVSEEEKRLFNTDPKKERAFIEEERRQAVRGTPATQLPSPSDPGAAPRTLSRAARTRKLLAEDAGEVYVPSEADYEERVTPPKETLPAPAADTRLVIPHDDAPATVCAVVGEGATLAAYNLGGLLARAGRDAGSEVLFVDAAGDLSDALLGDAVGVTPDEILLGAPCPDVTRYVSRENSSNLSVMACAEEYELSPDRVIAKARAHFDLVIVACGWGGYADGWLSEADAVIAAGEECEEIASAADRAEALRGHNGTLVATLGDVSLTPEMMSRPVFRLADSNAANFPDPAETGRFGVLDIPEIGRTFVPLAERIISVTNDHNDESASIAEGRAEGRQRTPVMATTERAQTTTAQEEEK